MVRIKEIDQQLTKLFCEFDTIANSLDLPYICDLSDENTIGKQDYPGIYKIDINTGDTHKDFNSWIAEFQAEWEHPDFLKKFTPNTKKKRIKCHTNLAEWIPIYLGKSKKVSSRVLEHINLGLEKTTFALKLKARPTMIARTFRLSTIQLRVENYDLIAPVLEAALRNRFNPIIGKQ